MSQAKPTIALTGASGGIGRTLMPTLLREFEVRALFRKEGVATKNAAELGVHVVLGSLDDAASLERLVEGCAVVIHSAASVVRELSTAHKTNVEGTMRLAECASRAGVKRFVHLSTIAVYLGNKGRGGVFTEDLPLIENWKMDQYSRTKLRAEHALAAFAPKHSMEIVIVRPTCVYGPGIDAWTRLPLKMIRKGLPIQMGDGKGEMDAVHADDVVQAIMLAATHPAAAGETFNLGDRSLPSREFLGYYGRMLSKRVRAMPRPVVKAILNGGGAIERVMPPSLMANVSPNRLRLLDFCTNGVPGKPKFPSTKLRSMLGYEPRVSLSGGMLRTQQWAEMRGVVKRKRRFRHEEGNYQFAPASTVFPECEADIQQIVSDAAKQGKGVRAIGSIHSMAPLPATNAVCIAPARLRGVVSIDGARVTVNPGIRLFELNAELAKHGLALPIVGAIDKQTMSGAISTGTHGGSLRHGSVADVVESVRVVKADGEVLALDRSDERFFGVVSSMGLCGIVSQMTLACVPAFNLRANVRVLSFAELLEQFDALQRQHEYCDINWYPLAEKAEVMTCERVTGALANRESKRGYAPGATSTNKWMVSRALRKWYRGHWRGLHRRTVNGWVGTWYPVREGRSDYVLSYQDYRPSRLPVTDMDLSVPVGRTCDTLRAMQAHYVERDNYPVLGIRIRTQRAEKFWLSGSYDRDACWIETFHSMPATNHIKRTHDLMAPFQYRPHWGKTLPAEPQYWASVYPKWQAFQALRAQLDPNRMFVNDYVANIGLVQG